jgi:hypothetical protein
MTGSLLRREVLPFLLSFVLLALTALLADAALHVFNIVWVGRWLGIPGMVMILASGAYSARKRKWIASGRPSVLLRWHEGLAWAGSLLVLVHAGIHFNAILGWLAVWAMLINVGSGLTGKYLLQRSRARLDATRVRVTQEGLTAPQIEERMYWDSLTFDVVKQWRRVHFPITLAFGVLALAHIVAVCLFWGWR